MWVGTDDLVVLGHNDSDEELSRMAAWVVEHGDKRTGCTSARSHPDWKMTDVAL